MPPKPRKSSVPIQTKRSSESGQAEPGAVREVEAHERPDSDADGRCLAKLATGDASDFPALVERWQSRLLNFFYRSTGNRADAEDLVQETFIDLYRAAARYQARGTFSAYLFTLARRRMIDGFRKKSRRPLEFQDPQDYAFQQRAEATDRRAEIEEAFHRALSALPEQQQTAILLLQQQGLSYEEIAAAMDAGVGAVKTWIYRARQHLRSEMKDFYET